VTVHLAQKPEGLRERAGSRFSLMVVVHGLFSPVCDGEQYMTQQGSPTTSTPVGLMAIINFATSDVWHALRQTLVT